MNDLSADRIRKVLRANPGTDFTSVDLFSPLGQANFDWAGLDSESDRTGVLAYQRLLVLHADVDVVERLIGVGLVSANHIARMPRQRFLKEFAGQLGLGAEQAEAIHRRATGIRNKTMQVWASVRGTAGSPWFSRTPLDTISQELKSKFQNLPSYQDLFGSLDYVGCEECRSIFGAAAYLCDLLRIIDECVTAPNDKTIDAAFLFTARRPDIAEIELTCSSTNDLVPYLQIVNERLTARAAQWLDIDAAQVSEQMATSLIYPMQLPFNAPLDRVNVLLGKAGISFESILKAWKAAASTIAAHGLSLSPEQQAITVTELTTAAEIAPFYNVPDTGLDTLADADTFLAHTWMLFSDLLTLVQQDLSVAEQAQGLQVNFFINQGLSGKFVSLTADTDGVYTLSNLDVVPLDRINRLRRLAASLGVPAQDADWALRCMQGGAAPVISNDALVTLCSLRDLALELGLSLPAATVLLGPIKTYGQGTDGAGTVFDRLFNSPSVLAQQTSYRPSGNALNPAYQDTPLNWTPGSTAAQDVTAISRVLPGLGMSLTDINTLGVALFGAVSTALTVDTLSKLYRHSLLSRALSLPVARYVVFVSLLALNTPAAPGIAELQQMAGKGRWLTQTGVTVYQIDYIVRGTPSVYVNPLYLPASLIGWQQGLWQAVSATSSTLAADLVAQIAIALGAGNTTVSILMPMAVVATALPTGASTWQAAFLAAEANGNPAYPAYVQAIFLFLSRWLVMAQALAIADDTLASVAAHPEAYLLPATVDTLPWAAVEAIQGVQQRMTRFGDQQQNLLAYIDLASMGRPQAEQLAALERATGWLPDQVTQLLAGPVTETVLSQQLTALETCLNLLAALQADVTLLGSIAALGELPALHWSQYLSVADAVLSKSAASYGSQWESLWLTLFGALNVHQRDALLALVLYQLNSSDPTITAPRNVYEFLLTDVEIGPVTQISTLKEALNAAQLYLQRCRLRLEPGVNDLSAIGDEWWAWMMNYRVWEANRQIFVYPENYLIPSLRKNVSQQFSTLAQSLQQSDITKPYVASAFREYIDGFAEVAQQKPVDAFRTRTGNTWTTYLLGRTKTLPYTFSYCSQADGMPWTAWQKIDLTINSPQCTLVYAFNRPLLFWNEIKKTNDSSVNGSSGNVTTTNGTTYRGTVLYSFLNQEGKWAQPQTLVDQAVFLFQADDSRKIELKELNIFESLFVMDDLWWNKVFAFEVTAANYQSGPANATEAERLVVLYGPNLVDTGAVVAVGSQSPTTDPTASAFWAGLHDRAQDHNRRVQGQLSGEVLLRSACVLNLSLENDVLVHRREFLLADPYVAASPLSNIRADLQTSGAAIQLSHSGRPITDNRMGAEKTGITGEGEASSVNGYSFINVGISSGESVQIFQALKAANVLDANGNVLPVAMKTLDLYTALAGMVLYNVFGPTEFSWILTVLFEHMGATVLFGSVSGSQASVEPVRSQPGWFMVFLADEAFLLTPRPGTDNKPMFSTFTEGIVLGDPELTTTFGVMSYTGGGVDAHTSAKVFAVLVGFSLIKNGQLSSGADSDTVSLALSNLVLQKVLTDAQVSYLYHALINAPILFPDAFLGDKIDSALSTKVYTTLQGFSLIDPNGRIAEDLLTGPNVQLALANLLLDGSLSPGQMSGIYTVLAQAPKAVALRYVNRGEAAGLSQTSEFLFNVTRLSTGALRKVSRALLVGGIDALLDMRTQDIPVVPALPFERFGPSPTSLVWPSALDATQVDFDGLYGQYYWEIFYHLPMLVAYALNANQQFADAQVWLQYVFNPTLPQRFVTADVLVSETAQAIDATQAAAILTNLETHMIGSPAAPILKDGVVNPAFTVTTDLAFLKSDTTLSDLQIAMVRNILLNYELSAPASHFWRFRPARTHTLETLKEMLSDSNPAVKVYNNDPFDPFAIARLRMGAFEKSTLMQYVDNLIAWGDQLFTADTWESITAAYMLYVYTYDLLGPRPQQVGEAAGANLALTFTEIKAKYPSGIPQFLIDLEHFVAGTGTGVDAPMTDHAFNDLNSYFCVPENSDLMARWDTIQDRMQKINNSMNIAGVVRTLPLFQPPLNPLDLVRAAAAGDNVQGNATASPELSPYRYSSSATAAQSLCATVIDLGNLLLSALEKNDAGGLELLRSNQEAQILAMMTEIKQAAIDDQQATLKSLDASQNGNQNRLAFYNGLLDQGLNSNENVNLDASAAALAFNLLGGISKTAATIAYAVPQVGSPFAMTYGGIQVGSAVNAASGVFEIGAEISNFIAVRSATMAGYARRAQDWTLQAQQAQYDIDSLAEQIAAANSRLQAAQQDLAVHRKSIAQNKALDTYLRGQFTNQQLYQWMLGRLAGVYFQTYTLALRAARRAEAAFQFEMDCSTSFITFQYWDGLHNGLSAGEGLRLSLQRMDDAYRAGDTRSLEVERSISLAMTAPEKLLALKNTGTCTFDLPEALFDYDYPGQYRRKIATISLSIPAVVGPYQNIKAILTQTRNSVVTEPRIDVVNYLLRLSTDKPALGLRESWAVGQSIALSRGVDDSGIFVLDFQDQRYLPFENTGVVSSWQLDMPLETNRFDFQQLSDVILTLRYTARYDGALAAAVKTSLSQAPLAGGLYLNAMMQSAAWQAFLANHTDPAAQTLTLNVNPAQIGFFKTMTYVEVLLRLVVAPTVQLPASATFLKLVSGSQSGTPTLQNGQGSLTGLTWNAKQMPSAWNFVFTLTNPTLAVLLTDGFLDGSKLLSIELIVLYQATVF